MASKKSTKAKSSSKIAKVTALLRKGCTREQVLKVTGWKAVSLQQMAAQAGVKLKIDKTERPFRYSAAGAAK